MKKLFVFLATLLIVITNCPLCYSQMYSSFIVEGTMRFKNGNYDEAIKIFRAAAADIEASQAEKDIAREWIDKCNAAKTRIAEDTERKRVEKFILSSESLTVPATSGDTLITIDAGSPWSLVSYPSEWCEVRDEKSGISVKYSENTSLSPRNGTIVLKSSITNRTKKYTITHEIPLMQAGRDMSIVSLYLRTVPGNATVLVGKEKEAHKSGEILTLHEGETPISIRKTDFKQFDTTIVVVPYEKENSRSLSISLIPEFSIIELSVCPEDGASFSYNNNPTLKLDGHLIDMEEFLSDSSTRTFDDDKPVEMYKLYHGNFIAVPGGQKHSVSMAAVDFEPYAEEFEVGSGEIKPYSVNLTAKSGTLTINAGGVSSGTKVLIDSKVRGEAPGTFRVAKGTHTVSFQKDGYMSKESVYLIETEEGKDVQIDLDMVQCALYSINSEPEGASVILDGVKRWHTPVQDVRIPCGLHSLKVVKDGYLSFNDDVYFRTEGDSLDIFMQKAYPLEVKSDMKKLNIVFIDRTTKAVIKTDSLTNSTVQIPYGKYYLELRRFNAYDKSKDEIKALEKRFGKKDLAYRGRLDFNETKKSIYRLMFQDNSSFLKGNYFLSGMTLDSGSSVNTGYRYLANAGLINLSFIPGYTTSLVRVALFSPEDIADNHMYLAASCLFLNGEFRVGGSIIEGLDANANISYSWTPDISGICVKNKWNLSYVSGTDLFLGAEISSRIKVFNVDLKIGEQLFINGKLNRPATGVTSSDRHYDAQSFEGVQSAFVISAGFTFGSTRGNRMIRLF